MTAVAARALPRYAVGVRFEFHAALLVALAACADTPDLTYAPNGDAGVDATSTADAGDSGVGKADGAADAAGDGAASADGATGCATGSPPPGATRCCGTVPCVDRSGNGCNCGDCDALACPGWCCVNGNQQVLCTQSSKACK